MTNLKSLLLKKHVTQQELAEYCKISIACVQSFCQKKRPIENCRIDTLLKMAECLEVPFVDLFDDDILSRRVVDNVLLVTVQSGV